MNRRTATTVIASVIAILALAACGDTSPRNATPAAAAPPSLPEGFVTKGAATGTNVAAARASAQVGQELVIVGRIGGSVDPFVAGRAIFTIVDPALVSCADMDDPDHCKTPWDYCCEDRDAMKRGTATIEITDASGKPLSLSVRGLQGLDPLATIAVTGTVTERNDAGLLVVRAKRIEVR